MPICDALENPRYFDYFDMILINRPITTVLLTSVITLLNELANMHWQMSAICAVLIFIKNEEFDSIQYCLDKMFIYLMDALWTFVK